MPKVAAADVHLTYRGDKVLSKNLPFDSIQATMDINGGRIRVAPLRLGIGSGDLAGTVTLTPVDDTMDADVDVAVQRVDIGRLLATAGVGKAQGIVDGTAKVKGRGTSFSAILAHGDGMFHVVMPSGGEVSSLLVDLMGIEVGQAIFAAIGVPDRERIECGVADFALRDGILASRKLEVNTTEHVITGGGRIDLAREIIELSLRTDAKHFTIGTVATPISITGPLKHPRIAPSPEMAARGGVAIGLGLLFPPAALLPTIQFGVGEGASCAEPARPPTARYAAPEAGVLRSAVSAASACI